jgi:hypothetical protein
MESDKYYIYFVNWWPGFHDKTDANHVGFYEILFQYTKFKNFEITNDLNKANVLFEGNKRDSTMRLLKNWKYKINFIGEPEFPEYEDYDLVLTSVNNVKNIVELPLSVAYIHCNNFYPKLLNIRHINYVPENFCSFIVSNSRCGIRNKIFEKLNNYKKVNSMGNFANNVGYTIHYPYWSNEYFNIIGSYKFIICFENTKMETYTTEKIVNAYLAGTIPIYWGSHSIKNIFNIDSMLFLEDETEESFEKLINKIIELDSDDSKYLEFINRPIFCEEHIKFWNENYSLESLALKINKIIK